MTLSCPRCHAQHNVDPPTSSRARARPLRFRCSDCGHTFPVQTDQGAALPPALLPVEPPSRFAQEPRSVAAGEPVEMLRVGGDVYHVPDMATLQRWILEGRANREDSVSQHGMRWSAIGDRPDLAIFFAASERALPQTTSTIVPGPSPLSSGRAGLGLAPEEEIYVHEVMESNTSFVATPQGADDLRPVDDLPGIQQGDRPDDPRAADNLPSAGKAERIDDLSGIRDLRPAETPRRPGVMGRVEDLLSGIPNEPTSEAIAAEEASPTAEVPLPSESSRSGTGRPSRAGPNSLHVRSRTLEPHPGFESQSGTRGVPAPHSGFSGPGINIRGLAAHPRNDEATATAEPSGPVDEVPASMVARGEVDPMVDTLKASAFEHLRGDARLLGFELGPDPDTQEATMEATQQSNALADAFMATGNMGASKRENPAEAPLYVPPPIDFGGGKVPITIAPMAATFGSVLDEPAPPTARPSMMLWAALAAVAVLGAGGIGFAAWYANENETPATAVAKGAPSEARPLDGENPALAASGSAPAGEPANADNALSSKDKAAAEQAAEGKSAVDQAAADKVAADTAAAQQAAADKAAADKDKAARLAEAQTIVAEDAQAAAAKAAADKSAAAKAAAADKAAAKAAADKAAAAKTTVSTPKTSTSKSTTKPTGTSAKALADAGWKAMDKGNVEEAHGYFSRALQTSPGNGWATYGRGYANEKLGDKVSARSDYCSALSGAPSDGELVAELNGSLRRLGVTCN